MSAHFPPDLQALRERTESIVADVIGPEAQALDRDASWPRRGLSALREAGVTGLTAPARIGGQGQGLLGLAAITETIGKACASTAMCFGMHAVATAVIAAKATRHHDDAYLGPIACGEHFTTLALSEAGSGAHFFLPETTLEREADRFLVRGHKQFVTNGGHADSYVLSTQASIEAENGEFSCLIVDAETEGLQWGEAWHGMGMRANSSRSLRLDGVSVPAANLLGEEGDQGWYVFEVVAPYFLTAMAGTYLGVAQAALDIATQHLKARRYRHSGQALGDLDLLQHRIGQLWMAVEKSRLLLYHAARQGDLGSGEAMTALLAAKADAATAAVAVSNEAMTLCGGVAYRDNSTLARLLRDARAGHVMAPTTEMLTLWIGRSVLGLSLV